MGMSESLETALSALPTTEGRDQAAIALARAYAAAIDAKPALLADLGPKLQAALETLHMTPRARASVKGGKSNDQSNPLQRIRDELAERRGSREDTA
jgi:hypothetical protein